MPRQVLAVTRSPGECHRPAHVATQARWRTRFRSRRPRPVRFPYLTTLRDGRTAPGPPAPQGGSPVSADHAGTHCQRDHLSPVARAELAPDPGQVGFDGEGGEGKFLADLLVGLPVRD